LQHRAKIFGIAFACLAFGAQALTLGRVHGSALIGQPLNVTVEIQLDAGEDVAALCLDADVFQADVRQDAGRVRIAIEPATGSAARVRVMSSALIEEPVVSFNLRTGCGQKTSRRYVLLADLPGEVTAPAVPLVLTAAAPAPGATPLGPQSTTADTAAPVSPGPALAPKAVRLSSAKAAKPVQPKSRVQRRATARGAKGRHLAARRRSAVPHKPAPVLAKPAAVPAKPAAARTAGAPRLKLDPLEVLSDRVANAAPEAPPAVPDEAARNAQKVQQLEGDVKALRDSAAKSEASLADLKARLQKAEAERSPGVLVYALAAAALLGVLAAIFLWLRQRRALSLASDEWWNGGAANAVPPTSDGLASPPLTVQPTGTRDSVFSELMGSGAVAAQRTDAAAGTASGAAARTVRKLRSKTVLHVRQRAQALVSKGKVDEAVQVLKQQIRDSKEPNPFVYLDLLGLLHSLGLPADFKQSSQDFKLLFNVEVPEFASYTEQGRALESYADVLSTITALWAKPEAQTFIEACIFRDPWADKSQPFDLAAFRDLLLLQVIAQSESDVTPDFPELSHSALAELSAHPPAPAPALDLDLSEIEIAAPPAAVPRRSDIDLTRLIPGDHEQTLTAMAPLGGKLPQS